ncbi:phosphate ABC transporter permease PstA [Actinacidiphila guanduensis]|jgi:phosphate transport system permease protein|uniref:Phosphate transport system permease protein PstA n=1 Tax=Actinacidiphila guanduensis TaxID=310781 RepID=A0A1H0R0L5_9ACTN|nr:phosphate ABC transporter permease PstA [Actinacidiphila guanduensis]SDP23083.1 phosphate transport system permease protein [Actinacidiphila guanduensis]
MTDTVMDATSSAVPAPSSLLASRRLPRWTPLAVAVIAIGVAVGIGAGAGLSSHIQWGLIALALFVLGNYAVTARVEGRRQAKDKVATSLVWSAFILAVLPLYSLIETTIKKGAGVVNGTFLTHSMNNVLTIEPGGGVYHAIIGTLEQVGIAGAIATPIGIFTAIYLVEYGKGRLATVVTFFVDVMTGIPSIVSGLFILSLWFVLLGHAPHSGFPGSLALAILMTPIVVRSTEEMLKLVPNELREASLALGVPKWRTITKVVVPTAIGGITTGVMLALARIAGESAPIALLVFGSNVINTNPFSGPQSSLPYYIYEQYVSGSTASYSRAWGAALVLIAFVMILNLLARAIAWWKAPKHSGR